MARRERSEARAEARARAKSARGAALTAKDAELISRGIDRELRRDRREADRNPVPRILVDGADGTTEARAALVRRLAEISAVEHGASSGTGNATAADAMSESHFSITVTRIRMRGSMNLEFLDGHFERTNAHLSGHFCGPWGPLSRPAPPTVRVAARRGRMARLLPYVDGCEAIVFVVSLLDALEAPEAAAAAAADNDGRFAPFDDAVQVFRDLIESAQRWDQVYGRQAGAYGEVPIALFLTDADELAERLESGGRLSAEARELAAWGDRTDHRRWVELAARRRPSSSTAEVADDCKPALQLQSEVVDGVIARFRGACDDPDRLYAYRVKEAPGNLDEATGRSLTTALMQIVFERQFQYDFGGLM